MWVWLRCKNISVIFLRKNEYNISNYTKVPITNGHFCPFFKMFWYFYLCFEILWLLLLRKKKSNGYFCTLALFSNIFFTMSIFCISYPKRHVTTNYIKIEIEPFPCSSFPQSLSIFHRMLFSFIIHSLASHHIAILILLNE